MVFLESNEAQPQTPPSSILKKLFLVSSIAAAIQYGWALQLSLLTPYTQHLGLNHKWASIVWLCGPISGLIVQPIAGRLSDRCTSKFGRRRPFIVYGAVLLSAGVLLIGFAADIGRSLGDSLTEKVKPIAIVVFVLGFCLLDVANNLIQGPCRALLADISGNNDAMMTIGNALFAFFMAVGNIIGYAIGAYGELYRIFPFTKTEACDVFCADLKTCFMICIVFTTLVIGLVVVFIKEERLDYERLESFVGVGGGEDEKAPPFLMQIVIAARSQSREIWILYAVTALNWVGCFPFVLYNTDWTGKEVYGGKAVGSPLERALYDKGVRAGAMGLMLQVGATGVVSLFMQPLMKLLGNVGRLWGVGNLMLAMCMGMTVAVSKMAEKAREGAFVSKGTLLVPPPVGVKMSFLALFAVTGIPQAVTYSIPFALASIYSRDSDTGQGLALGLLNLAIVIPQMLVALISGPLDSLFGGSNLPAFLMGGIAAAVGGIAAMALPKTE